jgi:hypothetical protein
MSGIENHVTTQRCCSLYDEGKETPLGARKECSNLTRTFTMDLERIFEEFGQKTRELRYIRGIERELGS